MLPLLIALTAGAGATGQARPYEVCQVGRVALQDLPAFNVNRNYASYYAASDTNRTDLLDVCPELRRLVPEGYPAADDEARARASDHVPIPFQRDLRAVEIFSIDPPLISSDGKTALVTMRYECSGLCGGYTEFQYVRTTAGWHKDKANVVVVS